VDVDRKPSTVLWKPVSTGLKHFSGGVCGRNCMEGLYTKRAVPSVTSEGVADLIMTIS
jgi:hypothetical protein